MPANQFLTLPRLKQLRQDAGLSPSHIVSISASKRARNPTVDVISLDRLKQLENLPRHEPTYAEARDLSRILLLPGILPLITPTTLHAMPDVLGPLRDTDLTHWRTSDNVPLSLACRLTVALGLNDPIELEHMPIHSQIWAIISRNERLAAPGECPWCRAGSPGGGAEINHLPTCIPNVVWAGRSTHPYLTDTFPRPDRPNTRGDSRMALGLKTCRVRRGITAKQLANDINIHPNTMSRIERCDIPLTTARAEKIAPMLGCSVEALYA